MEIFGIKLFGLVKDVAGNGLMAGVSAIIFYQLWKQFNAIFRPVKYVSKLYDLADDAIEHLDDHIIDRIRNKKIKNDIQKELKEVLKQRKEKIDILINLIDD